MPSRIAVIQGHPDPAGNRFLHALAGAYANAAREAGHEVREIDVARLEFRLLRSKDDFEHGAAPEAARAGQDAITWAEHVLMLYPLWLGTMPALLKAYLEQVFRPGFAFVPGQMGKKLLAGRSARVVVTMGMPAFVYRWYFGAHGLKGLERSILGFVGIDPIRDTLIGNVEGMSEAAREKWLARMRELGRLAE